MASTERRIEVRKDIRDVWSHVRDMGNWSVQIPGYVAHREAGPDDSVWTLKVSIGPVERTVDVAVHVLRWDEPDEVAFTLKGLTESFSGGGLYRAEARGGSTAIALSFEATPEGPMATMINALAAPILEQVADAFSENLRRSIEGEEGRVEATLRISPWRRLIEMVRTWFRR